MNHLKRFLVGLLALATAFVICGIVITYLEYLVFVLIVVAIGGFAYVIGEHVLGGAK